MEKERISDDELMYQIHQDDYKALKILLDRYEEMMKPMIFKQGRSLNVPEIEEAKQRCRNGVYIALNYYREDLNIPFQSFASICASREVKGFLKKERTNGLYNCLRTKVVSYDLSLKENDNNYLLDSIVDHDPSHRPDYMMRQNILAKRIKEKLENLTLLEKSIYLLWQDGVSYQEISKKLGIKTKKVDNVIQSIKHRIYDCLD